MSICSFTKETCQSHNKIHPSAEPYEFPDSTNEL